MSDPISLSQTDHTDPAQEVTDWQSFRFPTRPPKRWDVGVGPVDQASSAPRWAAPPVMVRTWMLDMERRAIVHPVHRKKIDLERITTKRRLVKVSQMVRAETTDEDAAALWRALDDACRLSFNRSLPEQLSQGPDQWQWPLDGPIMPPVSSRSPIEP